MDPAVLQQLDQIGCPRCRAEHAPYFWLPSNLRLEVSARIRSRVYFDAHQLNSGRQGLLSED
jgi:hypothetical protein